MRGNATRKTRRASTPFSRCRSPPPWASPSAANLFTLFLFYEALTLVHLPAGIAQGRRRRRCVPRALYLGILLATSIGLFLPAIIWTYYALPAAAISPSGGILAGKVEGPAARVVAGAVHLRYRQGRGDAGAPLAARGDGRADAGQRVAARGRGGQGRRVQRHQDHHLHLRRRPPVREPSGSGWLLYAASFTIIAGEPGGAAPDRT